MTRRGIEPRSLGLLANTLLIRPMTWYESFFFMRTSFSPAILSNIHRYFSNAFHEFKFLKEVIITKKLNEDFHYKFFTFWIILFFQLFFIYIYIYIYTYIYIYIYIYICGSSNRFSLFLTIRLYHPSLLVGLPGSSCIRTEQLLINSCWSSNIFVSV